MRAAVLEFVLEGLHLGKRLNKTALDGSAVFDRQVTVAQRSELGAGWGRLLDGRSQHSARADDEDPHAQRSTKYIAAAVR